MNKVKQLISKVSADLVDSDIIKVANKALEVQRRVKVQPEVCLAFAFKLFGMPYAREVLINESGLKEQDFITQYQKIAATVKGREVAPLVYNELCVRNGNLSMLPIVEECHELVSKIQKDLKTNDEVFQLAIYTFVSLGMKIPLNQRELCNQNYVSFAMFKRALALLGKMDQLESFKRSLSKRKLQAKEKKSQSPIKEAVDVVRRQVLTGYHQMKLYDYELQKRQKDYNNWLVKIQSLLDDQPRVRKRSDQNATPKRRRL